MQKPNMEIGKNSKQENRKVFIMFLLVKAWI